MAFFCQDRAQINIWKLLVDEKEPILFVGESPSRSLPIAVAALRGSIDGIYVSREDDDCRTKDKTAALRYLIKEQKDRVKGLAEGLYLDGPDIHHDRDVDNWFLQADARSLDHFVEINRSVPCGVIWFQCPWQSHDTARLLRNFVESATKIQTPGDFLILGLLSEKATFWGSYEFDNLMKTLRKTGYTHVKDDTVFIQECIKHGYKHHSNSGRDLHEKFKSLHVTHIFVKRQGRIGDSLPDARNQTAVERHPHLLLSNSATRSSSYQVPPQMDWVLYHLYAL